MPPPGQSNSGNFFTNLGNGIMGGFAQSFGTALGGSLLGEDGFNKSDLAYSHHKDIETYKRIRNSNFRFQTKKGLNAYEALMGPQGGGETGPTASGQVLGNAQTAEMQQDRADARAAFQAGLDRQMQLQQTKMQTDAQIQAAQIGADAQLGVGMLNRASNIDRMNLDRDVYNNVTLPQAAENLNLTKEQVKKAINEVVTSSPKFVKQKILLQMGVENSIQTLVLNRHKLDITDRASVEALSDNEYDQLYTALLSAQSSVPKTFHGWKDLAVWLTGKSLEYTGKLKFPNSQLDSSSVNLGNYQSGQFNNRPDMNVR